MKKTVHWVLILILCLFIFRPVPGLLAGSTPRMINHTLNQSIEIQLPPSMRLSENPLREREQLFYSVYLNDEELSLRGYIQVWQLDDVEIFLANSKKISPFDFYSYTVKPITIDEFSGLVHEWGGFVW